MQKRVYIFSGRAGLTSFQGFSRKKIELDKAINDLRAARGDGPMDPWVYHDLRRTGATLLERVGIDDYLIERVIGHGKKGLRSTYRHWDYFPQKNNALAKLDALVAQIVSGKSPKPDKAATTAEAAQ